MQKLIHVILVSLMFAFAHPLAAQQSQDSAAVLDVVQRLFAGMRARDTVMLQSALTPSGAFYVPRPGNAGVAVVPFAGWITRMSGGKELLEERSWDSRVMIHGPVGVVWTPYDFHIDGKFSHCGVDVFNMIKTPEGWRIGSAMYTVEQTGCTPRPR